MTLPISQIRYRKLRAPRENRGVLVEPAFSAIGTVVSTNIMLPQQRHYEFQGQSLEQLTKLARHELLRDALRWTARYRDVDSSSLHENNPFFLAGHQPQLFHPGVWFKNFALWHLARQHNATAINLMIDSDTVKSTSLRVPSGSIAEPLSISLPLDLAGPPIPYEERKILDRSMFAQFGQRAADSMAQWIPDPLVRHYWPMAVQRSQETSNLGECLAQSRHQLEGEWGLNTLEMPQSWVCQSESFAWLAIHLLAHLSRFQEVYNQALHEYRAIHGLRNAAIPVPDLTTDGEWLESPFWIWSRDNPMRRPLFARILPGEVRLSDRAHWEASLPLSLNGDGQSAVDRWLRFSTDGIKIRSRALVTTLWARLVLSDLFIHGIGGAKYDQVTDVLIERFFGLKAPGFMVVSATLLLPGASDSLSQNELPMIERQLRELTWHPERWLASNSPLPQAGEGQGEGEAVISRLLAEKQQWVHTAKTLENAHERHWAIRCVNEALQPWVAEERQALEQRRTEIERGTQAKAVRSWREYGFPFYPADAIREFLVPSNTGGEHRLNFDVNHAKGTVP